MDPTSASIDLTAPTAVWVDPIAISELSDDQWYIGWRCTNCRHVSAIQRDPDCGAFLIRLRGRGYVCYRCRSCNGVEVQAAAQSVMYHHAPYPTRRHRVVG